MLLLYGFLIRRFLHFHCGEDVGFPPIVFVYRDGGFFQFYCRLSPSQISTVKFRVFPVIRVMYRCFRSLRHGTLSADDFQPRYAYPFEWISENLLAAHHWRLKAMFLVKTFRLHLNSDTEATGSEGLASHAANSTINHDRRAYLSPPCLLSLCNY